MIQQKLNAQALLDEVARITDAEAQTITEHYGARNYHPLPINIVRAEGVYAYDGEGNQYLDCIGSYSAVANGHLSPYLIEVLKLQLSKLTLTSRAVYTSELAFFLKELCEFTGSEMACPMNTGAEAVETAIKLARKWAYSVKGVPDNQAEIIVASENFHGRTTTIISFTSEVQYKRHFGPFTPGFKLVPFGDLAAMEAAITPNTAAILLEPIQAEGGILFPPAGYKAGLRRLCDRENVLLIWDEIQTGFCRTGKRFAWQHEEAEPDLMCLGKALGGGLLPVSATVGKTKVLEVFRPGDHGSTFGGNPLSAIVAAAAMHEMVERQLAENSDAMGAKFLAALQAFPHKFIEDVRGQGLLIGLEVEDGVDTHQLAHAFLEEGILTKETRSRTFRFAPPLTLTDAQLEEALTKIERALNRV